MTESGFSYHLQEFEERGQVPKLFQNSFHIQTMPRIHCGVQQYLKTLFQEFQHGCILHKVFQKLAVDHSVLTLGCQVSSSSEQVLVVIICFGKSLSGARSLTGTIFHSPPSPQLLPGLLRIHRQECVYTSDSSSLRQSGEVFSMSNFLQFHS